MALQIGSLFSPQHHKGDNKMIRYTLFVLTVLGTAATAIVSVSPANSYVASNPKNVSIFYKTDVSPIVGALVLEHCAKEDCSDTPSNS